MLNYTGVKIELLTDAGMVEMFEGGIRGGISFAPHKYMDAAAEDKELKYYDANNLYGCVFAAVVTHIWQSCIENCCQT